MKFRRTGTLTALGAILVLGIAFPASAKTRWTVYPSPNPGPNFVYQIRDFNSVAATSPTDAWAVGNYSAPPNGLFLPLIAHWDGASWSQSPIAPPFDGFGQLWSVSAHGSAAWAVGQSSFSWPPPPLVLSWDGASWDQVDLTGMPQGGAPQAVTVISPTDVWLVGGDGSGMPMAGHWNGSTWKWMTTPLPAGMTGSLQLVRAIPGGSDVMAIGQSYDPIANVSQTYAAERTGGTWQQVAMPTSDNQLRSLTMVSSTDGWAVGFDGGLPQRAVVYRWDGSAWNAVAVPHRVAKSNLLFGVDAAGPANVWAVGWSFCWLSQGCPSLVHTLVLHYNGSVWQSFASPDPSNGWNEFLGIGHIPGTGNFWVVGSRGAPRPLELAQSTFIARLHS